VADLVEPSLVRDAHAASDERPDRLTLAGLERHLGLEASLSRGGEQQLAQPRALAVADERLVRQFDHADLPAAAEPVLARQHHDQLLRQQPVQTEPVAEVVALALDPPGDRQEGEIEQVGPEHLRQLGAHRFAYRQLDPRMALVEDR